MVCSMQAQRRGPQTPAPGTGSGARSSGMKMAAREGRHFPDHRDLVLSPGVHRQSPEQSRAGQTQACHLIKLCDRQTHKTTAHCRDCRRSRAGLPGVEPGTRNHGVNQLFGRRLLRRPKGNAMRATGRAHRLPTSAVGLVSSDSPAETREDQHASDPLRRSRPPRLQNYT